MSPIEYIAEGIREGNWETVCEGYERLTGKSLPLPVTTSSEEVEKAKKVIRQMMEISSTLLDELTDGVSTKNKKRGRPKGGGSKKTKKNTVSKDGNDSTIILDESKKTTTSRETGGTRLITNEPDPEEVKSNIVKNKKARTNKAELNITTPTTYKVQCNECLQDFQSDRKGGEMGQKCKKCLSSQKGRFV